MSNYLSYKNYIGTVDFSAEDEVFYGKVHGINDLVTFEGASVPELKAAFEDAVNDYLQTCAQLGKPAEKTFKGSFNVRLSTELHKKAALIASKNSISLNDFVKRAIAYAVDHDNDLKTAAF